MENHAQFLREGFLSNIYGEGENYGNLGPKLSLIDRDIDDIADLQVPPDREWPPKIVHSKLNLRTKLYQKNNVHVDEESSESCSEKISNPPQKQNIESITTESFTKDLTNELREKVSDLESRIMEQQNSRIKDNDLLKNLEGETKNQWEKIESLIKDNSSLVTRTNKLNDSISKKSTHTTEEWKQMMDRIETLIQENDALADQNRAYSQELNYANENVSSKLQQNESLTHKLETTQTQMQVLEQGLDDACERTRQTERELRTCIAQLDASNSESQTLNSKLKRAAVESKAAQSKITELKKSLDNVSDRYQTHVRESIHIAEREKELLESVRVLEMDLDEHKKKYSSVLRENETLKVENTELLRILQEMEKKRKVLEEKEVQFIIEMQSHIEKAEDAKLERDKALLREEQGLREIQRLDDKMNESRIKFREKADNEILRIGWEKSAKNQFQAEKRKFLEEITKLESSHANMQNQMERAIREKRSAENELEKLTRHLPIESERIDNLLEEMNAKLKDAERQRLDAIEKLERFNQKMTREHNRLEKEKEQIAIKGEEHYRRLRRAEREIEESKEDLYKSLTKLSEAENLNRILEENKLQIISQNEADLSKITIRYEGQTSELTSKLEHLSDAHARTCREMQQLLTEQRRTGDRWKDDSKKMTSDYESVISELKSSIVKANSKIETLEESLVRSNAQRTDAIQQVSEEKKVASRLHTLLQAVESRSESVNKQIQLLLVKENEWISEKKHLQRDLDRLVLEKERNDKERMFHIKMDSDRSKYRSVSSPAPAAENDDGLILK
ncbi:hypothetical protein HK096_004301, partial [Nowakowskiella sp. JEL0078]